MIAELFKKYSIEAKYSTRYIKENPEVIKELCSAGKAIENISQIENLMIVGVGRDVFDLALEFSQMYSLLSTDSIHAATMKLEGLNLLATNDRDFERVDWLDLWKP